MKLLSTCFLGLLLLAVLTIVASQDEPPKKSGGGLPKRPGGRHLPKASSTTAAPSSSEDELEEADIEDKEHADQEGEEDDDDAPATSTEPAKKIGPIIRPFRSNDDLLNALKRRQQNVKSNAGAAKKVKAEPKVEDSAEEPKESAPAEKPKPVEKSAGRRAFGGRGRSPAPVSESHESDKSNDDAPTVKRPTRSRFTLNKN